MIFDWAGTVLDFGCVAPVEAFIAAFEHYGIAISEAEARKPMGAAKREHIELIIAMPEVQARWIAHRGAASTQVGVDELYAAFLRSDAGNVARYSDLIPGALDVMQALRSRGILVGSTTGYSREVMKGLIPLAEAQGYPRRSFETIIARPFIRLAPARGDTNSASNIRDLEPAAAT